MISEIEGSLFVRKGNASSVPDVETWRSTVTPPCCGTRLVIKLALMPLTPALGPFPDGLVTTESKHPPPLKARPLPFQRRRWWAAIIFRSLVNSA